MKWQLIIVVACSLVAFLVGRSTAPEAEHATKVVYRDRVLLRRDTVRATVPVEHIIYKREHATRVDTVYVPITRYRIIPMRPLRITRRRAVLTLWNQDSLRWEQQVYRIREPAWGLSIYAGVRRSLEWQPVVGIEGRYRSAMVFIEADGQRRLALGVRIRYRLL